MPPLPVIPNCIQVRLIWTINGQLAINVLNAVATGTVTVNQTLANTVGGSIKTAFQTNLAALITVGNSLAKVGLRDLRSLNLAEFLDTGGASPGASAGDPLPGQTALCITLRTAQSGKSFS